MLTTKRYRLEINKKIKALVFVRQKNKIRAKTSTSQEKN